MNLSQEDELAAMASDPHIHRELDEIEGEFLCTELDGLADVYDYY